MHILSYLYLDSIVNLKSANVSAFGFSELSRIFVKPDTVKRNYSSLCHLITHLSSPLLFLGPPTATRSSDSSGRGVKD